MKYIYLDQNKWIELLKGLNDGKESYIELYRMMQRKVQECEWAFPISLIHITEAMKRKDEQSRKLLLDLMYVISCGYSISDYSTANILEFNMWVQEQKIDIERLREEIIQRDWVKLIGLSTSDAIVTIDGEKDSENIKLIKSLIKQNSCDRLFFDMICKQCEYNPDDERFYYECFVKCRNDFAKWKENISKIEGYKEKHIYPAFLINVFFSEYKDKLEGLPQELKQKMMKTFEQNSKNKTMSIKNLETLPGFNIHNRLVYELYNNPSKPVHPHDFNDLAYMRVAIPYCDVVIGENYWCDRIKNYALDNKYGTIVSTKLFDLLKE